VKKKNKIKNVNWASEHGKPETDILRNKEEICNCNMNRDFRISKPQISKKSYTI
jgi:hypothetical protein